MSQARVCTDNRRRHRFKRKLTECIAKEKTLVGPCLPLQGPLPGPWRGRLYFQEKERNLSTPPRVTLRGGKPYQGLPWDWPSGVPWHVGRMF